MPPPRLSRRPRRVHARCLTRSDACDHHVDQQAAPPHTGSIDVNPVASAILVLNAGSSSLKFSIFAEHERDLALTFGGEIDALDTAPRFIATARDGTVLGDKAWGTGVALGHDGALDFLLQFLPSA